METFVIDIRSFLKDCVVPPEIAHEFAVRLGLEYVPENGTEGRVCLAAHSDVRPEYRDTFTSAHVRDYVKAILYLQKEPPQDERLIVPYPVNALIFWKLVQKGGD
jgi:hypothetical protein